MLLTCVHVKCEGGKENNLLCTYGCHIHTYIYTHANIHILASVEKACVRDGDGDDQGGPGPGWAYVLVRKGVWELHEAMHVPAVCIHIQGEGSHRPS